MNKGLKIVLIILLCIIIVLLGAGSYFYFLDGITPGRILNNITVAGVYVGNMTKQEATSTLNAKIVNAYANNDLSIQVDDKAFTLAKDAYDAQLDIDAVVDIAYKYGRKGTYKIRKSQQATALNTGYDVNIAPYLQLDSKAVQAAIAEFSGSFDSKLNQTTVSVEGKDPDLTAPMDEIKVQQLVIKKGTSQYRIDEDVLYDAIVEALTTLQFQTTFSSTVTSPDDLDFKALYAEYSSEAVDAVMDPKTFEITKEVHGYDFDVEAAQTAFKKAKEGDVVKIPFRLTAATVTYQSLYDSLFPDVLSTFTAYCASDANRIVNLSLACKALDGLILYPGDEISYSNTLGERTAEAGYKPAGTYVGSESVATYGGGICQVSSCLYYCAVVADLEILQRHCHSFHTGYMPVGTDATIFWGGPDLRFRNNTDRPIRINASSDGGSTTVSIMGVDDKDYYVKFVNNVTGVTEYKTVEEILPEDNPKGYKDGDVITSPYTGYSAVTYRNKYDKETDELISSEWEANSYYSVRDKVICRIEKPEDSQKPTEDKD